MLSPGDSGSLLMTYDNIAVGLGFATMPLGSIHNSIDHVRRNLRVAVAETFVTI